ncbi:hypothetical protein pb186bvf_016713 [Paramecium bursaria]
MEYYILKQIILILSKKSTREGIHYGNAPLIYQSSILTIRDKSFLIWDVVLASSEYKLLKNQAAKVIFQDYNESTKNILEQQLKLNFDPIPDHQFIFGDWDNITVEKVDTIVASEVIYREENYKKVINFVKRNLKENGKFYMINKNYYFGVGGSIQGFLDVCDLKIVDQIKFNQKGVKKTLLIMTL